MTKLKDIPEDIEFSQIQEIIRPENLRDRLQENLGPQFQSGDYVVESCEIKQVHYKPGGDCRLLFTTDIRHKENRDSGSQIFFGKVYQGDNFRGEFESLKQSDHTIPRYGPPVVLIPEWKTILWAYPNDPNLSGLPLMVDPEAVLAKAKQNPADFGLPSAPVSISAKLTKYVPGKRCGYIYKMRLNASDIPDASIEKKVYGKAYKTEEGLNAFSIQKQIWESEASRRGEFYIPQPFSYDKKNNILWQDTVTGKSFAKTAGKYKNLPEIAKEIGGRLAAYHNTGVDLPRKMDLEFQIKDLTTSVKKVRDAFPDYADKCAFAEKQLLSEAEKLENGFLTPIHASFKFSHIFMEKKGIVFIDFDGANLGDPGYDLGRLIAHLYKMKANWKIHPDIADRTIENFCNSYNEHALREVKRARIDWFAASHLVSSQVYKAVKRMDPGMVSKLLRISMQLLSNNQTK